MAPRLWLDKDGNLVAEWPPGSGEVVALDAPVLDRVLEKFGSDPLGAYRERFGPLQELATAPISAAPEAEGTRPCPS